MEAARRRLKGASLHDVAPDCQERLVDFLDDVGTRQNEMIVASFERFSAEILSRKIVALDVRPHRAVVNQYPALNLIQITRLNLSIGHAYSARPRSLRAITKKPARKRQASALADCLTWPQVALNRHEVSLYAFTIVVRGWLFCKADNCALRTKCIADC